jgi:hypothetical protein
MTKHRPPLSFDAALARVVGQLPGGYDDAAARTGRSISLVRAWGDPDRREKISIDDALVLDLAFGECGGFGSPFFEAFAAQRDLAAAHRFALPQALGQLLPEVLKENSEAEIALTLASRPGVDDAHLRHTVNEADEAIAKWQQVRSAIVHHQTGPPAGA